MFQLIKRHGALCVMFTVLFGHIATITSNEVKSIKMSFNEETEKLKRSVEEGEDMPLILPMTRTVNGKTTTVSLSLEPTLTAIADDETHSGHIENFGVYQEDTDESTHVLIIERTNAGKYRVLEGLFTEGEQVYDIKRDVDDTSDEERKKRDNGEIEVAKRSAEPIQIDSTNLNSSISNLKDLIEKMKVEKAEFANENGQPTDESASGKIDHVIEIAMVVDFSFYNEWKNYIGHEKAIQRIRTYVSMIAIVTRLPYKRLRIQDKNVDLSVKHFNIITREGNRVLSGDFTDATEGLIDFLDWLIINDNRFFDHHSLITSNDFGSLGVAFIGQGCVGISVSLVSNYAGSLTGQTLAHEIGHGYGCGHDELDNPCSAETRNLMWQFATVPNTRSTARNRFIFSRCSRNEISSFLDLVSCTRPENTMQEGEIFPDVPIDQQSGQVINLDQQCRHFLRSKDSYYCMNNQSAAGEGISDSICRGIFCYNPIEEECQVRHAPLPYSPCDPSDSTMVCRAGLCQRDCTLLRNKCRSIRNRRDRRLCNEEARKCRKRDKYPELFRE